MKVCSKCGNQCGDDAAFCNVCGTAVNPQQTASYTPPQQTTVVYQDPTDHTSEFEAKDISDNKVLAMAPYLLGWIGIIIALLGGRDSKFAAFHVRQALKIEVLSTLTAICTALLFWTIIIGVAGFVCIVILFVVKIICFFQVCAGYAKEPPIVKGFTFFK